ncbi:SAC3 family protein 1 [Smittium mucronatum]|uniref:SAC3 family protein 1 n=1 Tax=Smittium mucronatum TaxID=133383 RepID=A0A1R0GVG6_9FUNG|nr:SAC3 family protein 1 [Smittium mucronatum]
MPEIASNDERDQRFNKSVDTNRYTQLKAQREVLRAEYIKRGILDDPNAKMSLLNAKAIVGTCLKMCPDFEAEEREYQKGLDKLEMIPGTDRVDKDAAVKTYHRSAAGNEQPLPEDIRTPDTLNKTMDYLINTILAEDHKMSDSHQFIRDRTRSIRQDFSLQNIRDLRSIKVFERIARYHILAVHMLSEESFFSEAQEMEQLKKTLQSLLEFYDELRLKSGTNEPVSENEAEMRSYHLLAHMRSMDGRLLTERLPDGIFWSSIIQQSLKLVRLAQCSNSLIGRNEPPNLDGAQNFFTQFFKQIRSENTPYLLACVAEFHFSDIRRSAIKSLNKAIFYQENFEYPTPKLSHNLGFDTIEECIEFVSKYSIKSNPQTTGFGEKFKRVYVMIEPEIKPKRRRNISILEKKRVGMSNSDIVNLGTSSLKIQNVFINQIPSISVIKNENSIKNAMSNENGLGKSNLDLNFFDKEKLKTSFNIAKSGSIFTHIPNSASIDPKKNLNTEKPNTKKIPDISFDFSKAFSSSESNIGNSEASINPDVSYGGSDKSKLHSDFKPSGIEISINSNLPILNEKTRITSPSSKTNNIQAAQPFNLIKGSSVIPSSTISESFYSSLIEKPLNLYNQPKPSQNYTTYQTANQKTDISYTCPTKSIEKNSSSLSLGENVLKVKFGKRREIISLSEISKAIYEQVLLDLVYESVGTSLSIRKEKYDLLNDLSDLLSENLFDYSLYTLAYQISFGVLYKEKADNFFRSILSRTIFNKWLSGTRKLIRDRSKTQKQREIVASLLSQSQAQSLKHISDDVYDQVLSVKPARFVFVDQDPAPITSRHPKHYLDSVKPTFFGSVCEFKKINSDINVESKLWESASLGSNMSSVLDSLINSNHQISSDRYLKNPSKSLAKLNISVWSSSSTSLAMRWFWWQLDNRLDQFNELDKFTGVARFICGGTELNFCEGDSINSNLKSLQFEPDAHILFLESPQSDDMKYWGEFNLMLEKISVFSESHLNKNNDMAEFAHYELINLISDVINYTFSSGSGFMKLMGNGLNKGSSLTLPKIQYQNANKSIYNLLADYCTNSDVQNFVKPIMGYDPPLLKSMENEFGDLVQFPVSFISLALYIIMKAVKKTKHFLEQDDKISLKLFLVEKISSRNALYNFEQNSKICIPEKRIKTKECLKSGINTSIDFGVSKTPSKRPFPLNFNVSNSNIDKSISDNHETVVKKNKKHSSIIMDPQTDVAKESELSENLKTQKKSRRESQFEALFKTLDRVSSLL